jgi:hypothetical protein
MLDMHINPDEDTLRDRMIEEAKQDFAQDQECLDGAVKHDDLMANELEFDVQELAEAMLVPGTMPLMDLCDARNKFIAAYDKAVNDKIIEVVDDLIFDMEVNDND